LAHPVAELDDARAETRTGVAVRLAGVRKRFGRVNAADGIDLEIHEGEFFSMLGPSGSGTTTCLRLIAGFDTPTEGRVYLDGDDVTDLPPYERDVNTVFQDYALFPHMTVAQNVEYGLKVKKVPPEERRERVAEALAMVRLSAFGRRKPSQLSSDQRQRVALARALVNRPKVLLMDDPLGALDPEPRRAMQIELREIQRRVGLTFVYVTHNQEDALTMSDRLAVFNAGRAEQVGTPADVYEHPATAFVAGFVGTSNVLSGDVASRITGSPDAFTVRPEKIHMIDVASSVDHDEWTATGHVRDVVYIGALTKYIVSLDVGGELVVFHQNVTTSSMEALHVKGRAVRLAWSRQNNRPVEGAVGSGGSADPGAAIGGR
jgi:putative spermidine/putrescine transport system ATP-binding protein